MKITLLTNKKDDDYSLHIYEMVARTHEPTKELVKGRGC
jgi:hypothetical protein